MVDDSYAPHTILKILFFFPCGVQRMECTLPTSIHQPLVTFSRLLTFRGPFSKRGSSSQTWTLEARCQWGMDGNIGHFILVPGGFSPCFQLLLCMLYVSKFHIFIKYLLASLQKKNGFKLRSFVQYFETTTAPYLLHMSDGVTPKKQQHTEERGLHPS